ncbi:MAG: hypothetical protein II141_11160 [Clostridia bacterium]|nr:hypothetical protein [Clostridia bacterium]
MPPAWPIGVLGRGCGLEDDEPGVFPGVLPCEGWPERALDPPFIPPVVPTGPVPRP